MTARLYECQRCRWRGTSREIESECLMGARYDPPEPADIADRCPNCSALDSMEEYHDADSLS